MCSERPNLRAAALLFSLVAFVAGARGSAQELENKSVPATGAGSSDATSPALNEEMISLAPHSATADGRPERVQYVGPDTYILRDAQGRPQAMPGMTYEDFLAAWKRLQQVDQTDRRPRFVIDRVEMVGRARERHAELECRITVRLLTEEPVDVPLGMAEAILQGEANFDAPAADDKPGAEGDATPDGNDNEFLDYDPQRGGFVARFAARSSQPRTVTLPLLVPLSPDAGGNALSLTFPRTTSSRLTFDVNAAVSDAAVSGGVLTEQETTRNGTRLVIVGGVGPLRLTWRTPESTASVFTTVFNVQGAIRVAIDGRSVRTNARLTVQSYGGSFDRLRVRLPYGAQLILERPVQSTDENPAYRISLEPQSSERAAAERSRQIVLVEFPEKQRGPAAVDFTTEQPIGLGKDSTVELAGMEVLGAVRQFGDVVLQVAPDWQANWDVGLNLRQVDPTEVDTSLQQPDVTAAFQYDREPWSLPVRVAARKFRVMVTPNYELECSPDEARLTVRLIYQVLGARAFGFRVNLNGWALSADPVESGGLVDNDRIFVTPAGVLELPLAQALSRRAEIAFTVKRTLERSNQSIHFPLPVPIADSVSPGDLVVRTSADVDLAPDLAQSTGLVPRNDAESPVGITADTTSERHFRTSGTETVFAADRTLRSREVSHNIISSIAFEESEARVEQQFDYDVRYESIQELRFEFPDELRLETNQPEIALLLNGGENAESSPREVPLRLTPPPDESQSAAQNSARMFRVALPQARLGKFSVVVRFSVDKLSERLPAGAWKLPLVQSLDGNMGTHRIACRFEPKFTISLDPTVNASTWQQISPSEESTSHSETEFIASQPEASLPLHVQTLNANSPAETFVDRVWLQTWVSGDERQERAAFRFRTAGAQATVELAPQTPDALEVLLDGERADILSREPGRVVVAVHQPTVAEDTSIGNETTFSHTLELRYRVPIRTALLTRHVMTPHQIVGSNALTESYWQVILPTDTHVIRSPGQMTAANVWQWLGSFWGRRPVRSQQELEEWSGAAVQSGPAQSQNEYLFTGLSPVSTMQFVTAPRWLIVLVASASVLGLALGCIHVPALRRPWMIGAVGCLLAGLALAFPAAALLLAQASALGLVLAVLTIFISRLVARPAPWGVIIPASGTHRDATPRLESIVMPPVAATASTSPTVPLRVPEPE